MSGTCQDCRHWHQLVYGELWSEATNKRIEGSCERMVAVEDEGGADAAACIESDGPHYGVYFMTAPDFGCTMFEPRD